MKIKVEYSESIQVSEGMWRKIGFEAEGETTDVDANALFNNVKSRVIEWHKEASPSSATNPNWDHNTPLPKIQVDKTQSVVDAINKCSDTGVLESFYKLAKSKPEWEAAYNKKMEELS